ncbi:MAG: acetate kinase [Acidobacteriia bacterium]|nr:acetate kinase [Terriglobia bacterium]
MKVLVLNSGSSSQKSCLYELAGALPEHPPEPPWQGTIEWAPLGQLANLDVKHAGSRVIHEERAIRSRQEAIEHLLHTLWEGKARVISGPEEINVVGHRVVHGGQEYTQPTVITPQVIAALSRLAVFAPLHNRAEVEGIETVERVVGPVPQVAVFDTAFHSQLPLPAAAYPGPFEWLEQGIRRYGFHGINHQYCAERAAQLLAKDLDSLRLVTCHLGNGCSLAAVRNGRSIDTTMGFTPLDGLMMGSRSGSIDPGILTYLMRQSQMTGEEMDDLLNKKSGLLGISGVSSDMREVLTAMASGNPRAKLAFEMFVHQLRSYIGAMIGVLEGIDVLVFTAGIGENSPEVRATACGGFGFLGLKLDLEKNARPQADQDIATPDSAVRVLVIRAQEDWAIARECWRLARDAASVDLRLRAQDETATAKASQFQKLKETERP